MVGWMDGWMDGWLVGWFSLLSYISLAYNSHHKMLKYQSIETI